MEGPGLGPVREPTRAFGGGSLWHAAASLLPKSWQPPLSPGERPPTSRSPSLLYEQAAPLSPHAGGLLWRPSRTTFVGPLLRPIFEVASSSYGEAVTDSEYGNARAAPATQPPSKRSVRRRLRSHCRAQQQGGAGREGSVPASSTSSGSSSSSSSKPSGATQEQERNWFSSSVAFMSGVLGSLLSLLRPEPPRESGLPRLVQELGRSPIEAQGTQVYSLGPVPRCTTASDLRLPNRHFTVVTTAALPWKTGPAINPLLRSLHLAKRGNQVVLVMPWIEMKDQALLFPESQKFENEEAQAGYIKEWCREHAGIDPDDLPLEFRWYKASYVEKVRSVFPDGDVTLTLGSGEKDVLILEEPEHLCWYHNGQRWPELFRHVIGVVHTNYQVYIEAMDYDGIMGSRTLRSSLFFSFSSLVCSAYCDVTVKLSHAGISLPNEVTCNIHGVRQEFFNIGSSTKASGELPTSSSSSSSSTATIAAEKGSKIDLHSSDFYYLGKAVFQKGWEVLLDMLEDVPEPIIIDGYGSGPDFDAISQRAGELSKKAHGAKLRVFAGIDHASEALRNSAILVNPSISEMLCTVTAEALAMGKRAVLADHPSNSFFAENFPERCHLFTHGDVDSFMSALREARGAGWPGPLSQEQAQLLSWEDAIERLIDTSEVRVLSGQFQRPSEVATARLAYEVHRGFQEDTPAVASLLKDATLKAPTPWEAHLAAWRGSEAAQEVSNQIQWLFGTPPKQEQQQEQPKKEPQQQKKELQQQA